MRIDLHCHTKKVSVFFPRQNKMLLFTPFTAILSVNSYTQRIALHYVE